MIYLITGSTGAGKTTIAREFKEKYGAILFSIDEWNDILFSPDKTIADGLDWMLERIDRAEKIIWDLCVQMDIQSQDVVLDLGFSTFEHREKFRQLAQSNMIELKLVYLNYSREDRYNRVVKRNLEKGDTYVLKVTDEMFDFMETRYEHPDQEELVGAMIIDEQTIFSAETVDDYFRGFSVLHRIELDFCAKLSLGLKKDTNLDILRTYVLDFWKKVLSNHFEIEKNMFINLSEINEDVKKYKNDQENICLMMKAIENNESVSSSYLNDIINSLNALIRFKELNLYPFLISYYDDFTLRALRKQIQEFSFLEFQFSPEFWEKS